MVNAAFIFYNTLVSKYDKVLQRIAFGIEMSRSSFYVYQSLLFRHFTAF